MKGFSREPVGGGSRVESGRREMAQLSRGGGLRGPDQLVTGDFAGKVTGREDCGRGDTEDGTDPSRKEMGGKSSVSRCGVLGRRSGRGGQGVSGDGRHLCSVCRLRQSVLMYVGISELRVHARLFLAQHAGGGRRDKTVFRFNRIFSKTGWFSRSLWPGPGRAVGTRNSCSVAVSLSPRLGAQPRPQSN